MTGRLFLLCFLAAPPASAETPGVTLEESLPHLTVTGEAGADVMPDQADLDLSVGLERKSADAAMDAAAQTTTSLVAALEAHGVGAGDIHASTSLSPTFDGTRDGKGGDTGRSPRGYRADAAVTVHLRDIAKVAPLAHDLLADGVASLSGIAFSNSKAGQKARELDGEAMRDALQQARTYTDAVGLKLGRVLRIGEDPSRSGDGGGEADASAPAPAPPGDDAAAVTIEPGVDHVRRSVTVVWEIEGLAR